MFNPTLLPYVRVQSYSDNIAPDVLADEFYNPVQDNLARLFGAGSGSSTSIACEEFDRESPGLVGAGAQFGTELNLNTATNAEALSTSAIAAGDHGVWKAQAILAAAFEVIVRDNMVFPGARKYIWTARVRFTGRANFESRANEGFVFGLWAAAADTLPAFRGGGDVANIWAYYFDGGDVFVDTGVALIDDEWYTLVITRDGTDNKVRFYVGTGTTAPTLRVTSTNPLGGSITGARRFLKVEGTAGSGVGDGFWVDKIARGIER